MKIADFREAAMEWTVTIEGPDEHGEIQRAQLRIELLAEFLTVEPAESHQTVRKRTLTIGARLEDQSLRQERENPPLACERKQLEFGMPGDPLREAG
jgi:hypothetical protein